LRNIFERYISNDNDWESFLRTLKRWKADGAKQFQIKMKMTFVDVPAAPKKIIEKSPIIIIDSNPNSILNNIKIISSSGRNKIERGKSPSSDFSTFDGDISKKGRKMNIVEAGNEFVRLIDFLI
jgi:hypothetical protein